MNALNGVELFLQVVETGSFVGAARLAGVSPSAASKSIARLEARLSVRLFHRSTRSLSLTDEGKTYLETCRSVMAQLQSIESRLGNSAEMPQGTLRISVPMVSGFLLQGLSDFSLRYPSVRLEVDFSDRLVDIVAEGFDVVIRTGPLQDSRLTMRSLASFRAAIVGSPAYFARHGVPISPSDLQHHKCLHYRFPHSGKIENWRFISAVESNGLHLPEVMTCNSLEARIHYAKQGVGLAWVPDFSIHDAVRDGTLLQVLDDYIEHTDAFSMVWAAGKNTIPKIRAFIDFLSERMDRSRASLQR